MSRIIAFTGKSNSGKSHILKNLMVLLLQDGYRPRKTVSDETLWKFLTHDTWYRKNNTTTDKTMVLDCHGVTVGVTSLGDGPSELDAVFRKFEKEECKIIVCGTHDTVRMNDYLDSKGTVTHVFNAAVRITTPSPDQPENIRIAQYLKTKLLDLVKEETQ